MKQKKVKKQKEASLLSKIIDVYFEQFKRRRAVKILEKQSWSFDFLSLLLVKASKLTDRNINLEIINRDGTRLLLTVDKAKQSSVTDRLDDSILNHLDNDLAIQDFIIKHSVR